MTNLALLWLICKFMWCLVVLMMPVAYKVNKCFERDLANKVKNAIAK